jgi:hypothetical protein
VPGELTARERETDRTMPTAPHTWLGTCSALVEGLQGLTHGTDMRQREDSYIRGDDPALILS